MSLNKSERELFEASEKNITAEGDYQANAMDKPDPTTRGTSNIDSTMKDDGNVEVVKNSKPIFRQCQIISEEELGPGFFALRPLGQGRYEYLDVQSLSPELLNTEHASSELKGFMQRGRLLSLREDQWKDIQDKCTMAAKVSLTKPFPFEKLALELRKEIYEHVLTFEKPIVQLVEPRGRYYTPQSHHIPLSLSILRVSRAINQECRDIFWKKNTFRHCNYSVEFLVSHKNYTENVRHLSFKWKGLVRDQDSFFDMRNFPNLKSLVVSLDPLRVNGTGPDTRRPATLHMGRSPTHKNRNKLFQSNTSPYGSKGFREAPGFDNLVQIRGLETVSVVTFDVFDKQKFGKPVDAFEPFLKDLLTLPKDPLMKAIKPRALPIPIWSRQRSGHKSGEKSAPANSKAATDEVWWVSDDGSGEESDEESGDGGGEETDEDSDY